MSETCEQFNTEYTAWCEKPSGHEGAHRGKSANRPVEIQWPADPTVVSDTQREIKTNEVIAKQRIQLAADEAYVSGLLEQRKQLQNALDHITAYALEAQKTPITREDMHDPMKAQTIFDEHKGLLNLVLSETGGRK